MDRCTVEECVVEEEEEDGEVYITPLNLPNLDSYITDVTVQ